MGEVNKTINIASRDNNTNVTRLWREATSRESVHLCTLQKPIHKHSVQQEVEMIVGKAVTKHRRLTLRTGWPDLTSWTDPGNQQCVSFRAATIDWRRRTHGRLERWVRGMDFPAPHRAAPLPTLHRIQCDSSKCQSLITLSDSKVLTRPVSITQGKCQLCGI